MITPEELKTLQGYSPERKVLRTETKVIEACARTGNNLAVSFSGGKDSTVLLDITAKVWRTLCDGKPLTVVYANTSNEFAGMESFVRRYCDYISVKHTVKINLRVVRGEQTYYDVLRTEGYPIGSKLVSRQVRDIRTWMRYSNVSWEQIKDRLDDGVASADYLRSLGASHTVVLYLTGIKQDNQYGKSKLAKRWRPLICAPFAVSEKCCDILKKGPIKVIEKELGLSPVIAEMASDGETRKGSYLKTGCNAFKGGRVKSKPMGFWLEQDVLWYIDHYKLPTAPVYGELVRQEDGTWRFAGEQRTGCKLCLFGCQFDPERLIRLGVLEPQTMDFALRPLDDGGLGYRDAINYVNKNCKCKLRC